jgi:hypothetical protein
MNAAAYHQSAAQHWLVTATEDSFLYGRTSLTTQMVMHPRTRERREVKRPLVSGITFKDLKDGQGLMLYAFTKCTNVKRMERCNAGPEGLAYYAESTYFREAVMPQVKRLRPQAENIPQALFPLMGREARLDHFGHKYMRYNDARTVAKRFYNTDHRPFIRAVGLYAQLGRLTTFETVAETFKGLVPIELLAQTLLSIYEAYNADGEEGTTMPHVSRRGDRKGKKGFAGVRHLLRNYGPDRLRVLLRSIADPTAYQLSNLGDLPAFYDGELPTRPASILELHDAIYGERLQRRLYVPARVNPELAARREAMRLERRAELIKQNSWSERLKDQTLPGGYVIVVPQTQGDIEDMGTHFHNCMSMYGIWKPKEVVGGIYDRETNKAIAAFQIDGAGRLIKQFLGVTNSIGSELLPLYWSFQELLYSVDHKTDARHLWFQAWAEDDWTRWVPQDRSPVARMKFDEQVQANDVGMMRWDDQGGFQNVRAVQFWEDPFAVNPDDL